jgi:hypothetical protein
MTLSKAILPLLLTISAFGPSVMVQSADTAMAHKAAATALLNSNNSGAAHLACPGTMGETPAANSPAGPGGGPLFRALDKATARHDWESRLPGRTCCFDAAVGARSGFTCDVQLERLDVAETLRAN